MTTIYLTRVSGDGVTPQTAYRPANFGVPHVTLMIDPARSRAIVVSNDDTITGTGVVPLLTAGSMDALIDLAKHTAIPSGARNQVNAWLAGCGLQQLTSQTSWLAVLHYAARQAEPAADLTQMFLAPA